MKPISIFIALVLVWNYSFCQKNNIEIGVSKYKFYNLKSNYNSPYVQYSIGSSRKISNHLAIGFNYARSHHSTELTYESYIVQDPPSTTQQITIFRRKYTFLMPYISFTQKTFKNQVFQAGLGPSKASGENGYYQESVTLISHPSVLYFKKESYYGGIAFLGYDYFFWRNRINIGADLQARYYVDFPFSITYGLQLGYNF